MTTVGGVVFVVVLAAGVAYFAWKEIKRPTAKPKLSSNVIDFLLLPVIAILMMVVVVVIWFVGWVLGWWGP